MLGPVSMGNWHVLLTTAAIPQTIPAVTYLLRLQSVNDTLFSPHERDTNIKLILPWRLHVQINKMKALGA
jgi:hypothetical protein